MRNFLPFGFVLLFVFGGFDGVGQTIDPDYIDGEFYIKLKKVDTKSFSKTSSTVNFQKELPFLSKLTSTISVTSVERSFYFSNSELLQSVYRVKIDNPKKGLDFMNSVEQDDNVEYIERVPLMKTSLVPNDPYENSANTYALYKIRAYDAWSISTGQYYITVAVVDDAVQTNHPDLAGNMIAGYDVADGDSNPNPPNPYPSNTNFSHGTHVAGIVGAITNNGIGVASLGFNSIRIMPVKVTKNSNGVFYNAYAGITWAAMNGAKVINMSWGGSGYSITEQNVITNAHNLGCVLVAAAGNGNSSTLFYPAAYSYVISVANTNSQDLRYSDPTYGSNYGSWVDISAPGTNIYSTVPFGNYDYKTGTSMASPLVASLCGFILSQNPYLSPDDVEAILKGSSDNIDYLNPSYAGLLGSGRINALNAVNYKYFRYNLQGSLHCAGSNITMDFIKYGTYNSGNTFPVQYAPINSNTYTNMTAYISTSSIICTLPNSLIAGYYKIRLVSTNPYIEANYTTIYVNGTNSGTPTGSPIVSQYALATTTLYNATSTCAGNSIALYANVSGYDSYWWTKDGQNYTASSTDSYFNASTTGNYTLNMMKCGNVYRSSNSIYLNFYNPTSALTASSNGTSTNFRLATCEGSPVTLSAGCQSGMNTLWNDGSTSSIRYINASSTRDFFVNCNNNFCNNGYSPPVRITALDSNVQSTKTGNWQDVTLWTSNLIPLNCQTVTIQAGHTVNVPINDAKANSIIIKGNLNFQNVSPTVKGKVGLGI